MASSMASAGGTVASRSSISRAEGVAVLLEHDLVVAEELVDELGVAQEALGEEVGGAEERDQLARDAPVLARAGGSRARGD